MDPSMPHPLRRLWNGLLMVGPGLFCIGYTIGTGSVTTMAVAGSRFGTRLLWVLALSCLFSWVLMEAYGRYGVVTGRTAIHSFRHEIRHGKWLALGSMLLLITGQWFCLSGIVGLSANAIYEVVRLAMPELDPSSYWAVLGIAIFIIGVVLAMLWIGNYSWFEKILVVFVTLMGLSFLVSMFIVLPSPLEIAGGLVPGLPAAEGSKLIAAAFVGTTMAAPTFVVRPLLMKGKGWTREHVRHQSRDSLVSALLMFVISGAIMVCATGALFHSGKTIAKVLDMVSILEPVAGKFAVALFLTGTLSAGLSSIFPIAMVAPLLVADYQAGVLDTRSRRFRALAAVAGALGLTVPVLGANPILAQVATQVAQVFALPPIIAGIFLLVNRRSLMGLHKAGWALNAGIIAAFGFSLLSVGTTLWAVWEKIQGAPQ